MLSTFKNLTKKQKEHLHAFADIHTLREFKMLAKKHAKRRVLVPDIEPCWECRRIAKDLGLPV